MFELFLGLLLISIAGLVAALVWNTCLAISRSGTRCPACLGRVPAGATRCRHCTAEITAPLPSKPQAETRGPLILAIVSACTSAIAVAMMLAG